MRVIKLERTNEGLKYRGRRISLEPLSPVESHTIPIIPNEIIAVIIAADDRAKEIVSNLKIKPYSVFYDASEPCEVSRGSRGELCLNFALQFYIRR